jgi:dTMP kinase
MVRSANRPTYNAPHIKKLKSQHQTLTNSPPCGIPKYMYFLAFEGLDGSGKSSLMRSLETELIQRKIPFIQTREPGGTVLGEKLRQLILEKSKPTPVPRAELLMYEASRAQLVDELIKPTLGQKKWVLADRFSASSLAFQGQARGIGWEKVHQLNDFATDGLKPDLTILLDLSVEESEKRRLVREKASNTEADRIESENNQFHEKVRQGFLRAAKEDRKNWLVIDASWPQQKLFEVLLTELKKRKWLS